MAFPTFAGTPATTDNATSSTTYIGNSPAGITLGELLIAVVRLNAGTSVATLTDLQGFTLGRGLSPAAAGALFVLSKEAVQTDVDNAGASAIYNFVGDGSYPNKVSIFRVAGAASSLNAAESTIEAEAASTAWGWPGVTTQGADRLLLFVAGVNGSPSFTFNAISSHINSIGTSRGIVVGYETQAVAGASITPTATVGASIAGQVATIAIAPDDDVAPAAPTGLTATVVP